MDNKDIKARVTQFASIYGGSPWYGNSMVEILQDLSDEIAFWTPTKKSHSIAQLVWHIVYWRQSLIKRLSGNTVYKGSMKSEDNWSSESKLKALGWIAIQQRLHDSQSHLIELLGQQPDTLLDQAYTDKATFRELIDGIMQHDLYHLGQIAYLKNIYPHI